MSSLRQVALIPWLAIAATIAIEVSTEQSRVQAAIVFSEDFSSLSGTPDLGSFPSSERGLGTYLFAPTVPGWVLEGFSILVFDRSGDKALLLNETGGSPNAISRAITGLLPGVAHTLSFEYWGDNVTEPYSFDYEVNGVTTSIAPVHSGQNTGIFHTEFFNFTPQLATVTLRFAETSSTTASPIFDNITVSAVPEPSGLALGVLAVALGIAGRMRRRKYFAQTRKQDPRN